MTYTLLILIIILQFAAAYKRKEQTGQLLFIIKNQIKMSEILDAIKSDLTAAQALNTKIAADVTSLHAKIDALGDAPTAEQLQEVKDMSAALVSGLQATDDETADESAAPSA